MAPAIDRSRYVVVPRATVRRQLALARVLVKHVPTPASIDVEEAAKELSGATGTLTQAFADRHIESGNSQAGEDTALDLFVDDVWYIIDERLQHYKAFERPAVIRLAETQEADGFDYTARVEKARKAATLWKRLLSGGLEGLRLSHPEQAEFTRTLWTVIDQEGLASQLVEFVGADFVEAARDVQGHYDEMVDAQAARSKGSLVNLRELAFELQYAIQNYMIALLAMTRDKSPENVAKIRKALRPVDALREQNERERARSRGEQPAEPTDAQADTEADIDELLAEEQAVVEQIGGGSEDAEANE
jgi:hypothetical protein